MLIFPVLVNCLSLTFYHKDVTKCKQNVSLWSEMHDAKTSRVLETPYTPVLYCQTRVYMDIHCFPLKQRLYVLVRVKRSNVYQQSML